MMIGISTNHGTKADVHSCTCTCATCQAMRELEELERLSDVITDDLMRGAYTNPGILLRFAALSDKYNTEAAL